ncbi:MAG: MBL fold metallo-hydrolase [Akkermansiaceae bacterium]|nr:MBL fold metallo-hydrolase [Akkermansiaceae bacterium]
MLEDDYTDVIGKARIGHGVSESDLRTQAGASEGAWERFIGGDFDPDLAAKVEALLKLKAGTLVNHPKYQPEPLELPGVRRLELPFGQWTVNAWWVERDGVALIFDAGMGSDDLLEAMPGLPKEAFITHGHHDHVGGIEALIGKGVAVHGVEFSGKRQLQVGEQHECGSLRLKVCDLSGHYVPAVGYHIEGLEKPVLVVGDALFAGSMGKTADPKQYQLALHTLRDALAALSDDTVLLPGHGPATTVGEERANNPFL